MMGLKGNRFVTIIHAKITNSGPLHIGCGGSEILIEENTGLPYIPATSLAGSFRAYARQLKTDENSYDDCFGRGGKDSLNSKVYIYDAFGKAQDIAIEIRPGLKIDKKTGAASIDIKNNGRRHGHKFERQFLGKGYVFDLKIEIYSKDEKERLKEIVYSCLSGLSKKRLQLGGYKTSGAGEFELLKAYEKEYDLYSESGFFGYIELNGKEVDITDKINNMDKGDNYTSISIICRIDKPLLVKGMDSNDSKEPDAVNIKNSKGEFIIPGSSLKGVLRAQCKKIEEYLGCKGISDNAFGSEEKAGDVFVSDVLIGKCSDLVHYNRIKIDKFTGGTMTGVKFTESPVVSLCDIDINIKFKNSNDENKDDALLGMLLLALRDIGTRNIPIGSGSSVGRGRILFKSIKALHKGRKIDIDFVNKSVSEAEYIDRLVGSFRTYKGV